MSFKHWIPVVVGIGIKVYCPFFQLNQIYGNSDKYFKRNILWIVSVGWVVLQQRDQINLLFLISQDWATRAIAYGKKQCEWSIWIMLHVSCWNLTAGNKRQWEHLHSQVHACLWQVLSWTAVWEPLWQRLLQAAEGVFPRGRVWDAWFTLVHRL